MRDLLFKHLTSADKKRRVVSSSEVVDQEGTRTIIKRHFAYIIREVNTKATDKPLPSVYVLKERNTSQEMEKFFCKLKNSVYAFYNDKLYLILFIHTLKITLTNITEDSRTFN